MGERFLPRAGLRIERGLGVVRSESYPGTQEILCTNRFTKPNSPFLTKRSCDAGIHIQLAFYKYKTELAKDRRVSREL